MATDELEQRVIDIITTKQKLEPGRVTLATTFEELQIDSLDRMDLLFEFEEAFQVNVPDDMAHQIKTVRQVVEGLRTLPPAAAGGSPQ